MLLLFLPLSTHHRSIFPIPPEYRDQAFGLEEISCAALEAFGDDGLLPDELCTDEYRLIPEFRELCGCPAPPSTVNDDDTLAFDGSSCPQLAGCFLENSITGEEIQLVGSTGTQYTVMDDDSRHEWTIRCDFEPRPNSVTFFTTGPAGQVERRENTAPYYLGGDENGVANGVDLLGDCGVHIFDVTSDSGDSCGTTADFFEVEALCAFPTRAPVIAPTPHPIAPVAPTTPAPTDATCIRFQGCWLENALTGYQRRLERVDSYTIYEEESKWFWTVRCEFNPTPGAVTFFYPTSDGSMDMVEFHEPFYMGGDMPDGTPHGVIPFLSSCGEKTFQVIGDTSGCHSNKISYTLNAICDPNAIPVAQPTMPPSFSPCYAADLVLAKASNFLEAFTHRFARKSDRFLKKQHSGNKNKNDKNKNDKQKSSSRSRRRSRSRSRSNDNDKRDKDRRDGDGVRPIELAFDFVTGDDRDCELNIGAKLKIDTVLLGLPIQLDGTVAFKGLAVANEADKTLCLGSIHVNSFDIFGLSKFLLGSLEDQLGMDVPHFIGNMLGDKICL